MGSLRRIESFLEGLFEGSIGRLFGSPLQPAEIAKKLERAMEENYVVSVDGVIVPNAYDVLLNPTDLASLTAQDSSLVSQMEQWLREVAREERYRFAGPPRVRLISRPGLARRVIEVQATILDSEAETAQREEVASRDYRVLRTTASRPACRLKILNGEQAGQVYIIGNTVTSIGRALENDLVIESADISRQHARLEQVTGGYRLIDLGSTNGTRVNGRRTREHLLAAGDTVTLGATDLAFQIGDEPVGPGDREPRRDRY